MINLTALDTYKYRRADRKTIIKGDEILNSGGVDLLGTNVETKEYLFQVKSQTFNKNYIVKVKEQIGGSMFSSCTCQYDWGGLCKHEVAAINSILSNARATPNDKNSVNISKTLNTVVSPNVSGNYDQKLTILENPTPSNDLIINFAGLRVNQQRAITYNNYKNASNTFNYISSEIGKAVIEVNVNSRVFPVKFVRLENKLETSCTCEDVNFRLCVHKALAWSYLNALFGVNPLEKSQDLNILKDQMLGEYGYSLKDKNLDSKFKFEINDGKLVLKVLEPGLIQINTTLDEIDLFKHVLPKITHINDQFNQLNSDFKLFYCFQDKRETGYYKNHLILFDLYPATGKLNKTKTAIANSIEQYYPVHSSVSIHLDSDDVEGIKLTDKVSQDVVSDYLVQANKSKNKIEDVQYMIEEVFVSLSKLFMILRDKWLFEVKNQYFNKLKGANLHPLTISENRVQTRLRLTENKNFIILTGYYKIGEIEYDLEKIPFENFRFFLKDKSELIPFDRVQDVRLSEYLTGLPMVKTRIEQKSAFFKNIVFPLKQHFNIEIDLPEQEFKTIETFEPIPKIYLKEEGDYLTFRLIFDYGGVEVPSNSVEELWDLDGEVINSMVRDKDYENGIEEFMISLHESFESQRIADSLYLPILDLLKNNIWFNIFEQIKRKNITVFGFKELKKIKQNPYLPKLQIRSTSGIDWFGLKTEVTFGDQIASLKSIRDAILRKESFVKLGDGTLGMLPEEWLKKYSTLFQFSEIENDDLKLSRLHFSIIDELSEYIDDKSIIDQLEKKKQKIRAFKEIEKVKLSSSIKAELRPYQQEGLNWLNFLHEFNFGGCLADDMGLGKTIQVISFLQMLKEKKKTNLPHLVVMPKTLIFNWRNELDKFCPTLTHLTYYGTDRKYDHEEFCKFDVVLTTYGTVRSDIQRLTENGFGYVILDESQAIKNPMSQIGKAVRLLKGQNRLVMTGTPVENNTFDLYSQFDFVNPGILGNKDFFRLQYANKIDKDGDENAAKQLSKIVNPFLLRRTKELVASELPDKTETILFCEMGSEQRKVYDSYKNDYKDKIIQSISSKGINNSRMLILEGLMKLRQICDAPSLISNGQTYTDESVKLEEVMREILENTGNHKILVFSQFLKMLALIREQLELNKIDYEYFDGQTQNREEKINRFQQDDNCRVFLISLKAGGVGLNLTEADYVYLIDPWWNPAVEQQAIDRTHRIGQTKKVFAYKLICKDTIEEKIVSLQSKKKKLAEDLISAESGFVKSLTQKDIEGLFS